MVFVMEMQYFLWDKKHIYNIIWKNFKLQGVKDVVKMC